MEFLRLTSGVLSFIAFGVAVSIERKMNRAMVLREDSSNQTINQLKYSVFTDENVLNRTAQGFRTQARIAYMLAVFFALVTVALARY